MTDPLPGDPATLRDLVAHRASLNGDALALRCGEEQLDYRRLKQRIDNIAAHLATVAKPGERIAVLSWNSIAYVELLYAVPAAGMVLVPLNARLAPAEWAYQLAHSGATCVLAQHAFLSQLAGVTELPVHEMDQTCARWGDTDLAATPPAVTPADPAWLLYTSGSTGRPKGAVLSHQALLAGLRSARLGRPVRENDTYFYPFPLFHVAAHNVLLQHAFGACVLLSAAFDAAATLSACREQGVTTLSLAPTMIAMLLDHPEFTPADLSGVRTIGYGASAMPLDLLERLQAVSDVGLCQSYGMTELCGSIAFLTEADHREALSGDAGLLKSVGRPLETAQVRIIADDGNPTAPGGTGEIAVRAEQCFSYYLDDPAATAATLVDGWLHTGDMGRFDDNGYLYIVDRKKDMIISGGENIASREVEDVLRRHDAVADCAVIGLPDERWGERVSAVIQLRHPVDDQQLEAHCRAALAGYKTPRTWHRVDSLPVNAAGKVDKPALRARFQTG